MLDAHPAGQHQPHVGSGVSRVEDGGVPVIGFDVGAQTEEGLPDLGWAEVVKQGRAGQKSLVHNSLRFAAGPVSSGKNFLKCCNNNIPVPHSIV